MKIDAMGRLDSSFFEKRFIEVRHLAIAWERLDSHAKAIVCGPFGSNLLNDNYVTAGIPMIRPFNLRSGRADVGEIALLDEAFIKASTLKIFPQGTVMFARVGDIGAGISFYDKATISPNIIAADLRDSIDPYFVSVFANTRFGIAQLEAGMKIVAQPTISTEAIRALRIPPLSKSFQIQVAKIFKEAIHAQDQGTAVFSMAETTLLRALGLENWQAPEPLSYIRSSCDVFTTGRLDAEFFTPRVRHLLDRLGLDGLTIADVAPPRHERFSPKESGSFHYIEIGNIQTDGAANAEIVPHCEAPSRATQKVRAGDVITSTVRPIRRLTALIAPEEDGYVCSSGFVVLQPRQIMSEVLLIYLRLKPICELMDLHTSASLYPAISENDLVSLPIPSITAQVQRDIKTSVSAARQAKQWATQLLDAAKHAVEIAIEDSEAAALAYCNDALPQYTTVP